MNKVDEFMNAKGKETRHMAFEIDETPYLQDSPALLGSSLWQTSLSIARVSLSPGLGTVQKKSASSNIPKIVIRICIKCIRRVENDPHIIPLNGEIFIKTYIISVPDV